MEKNYIENNPLNAPGLAITGTSGAVPKTSNTFRVKANGIISDGLTTADAPALSASLGIQSAASTSLATAYTRIYTLLSAVNTTTGVQTLSWVHGPDVLTASRPPRMEDINFGNDEDSGKAVVGFVIVVNAVGSAFVPGTTALDLTGVTTTYIDNFGIIGF